MVRPIDRLTERRDIRRAAEEALGDTPTDPHLPVVVLPQEIEEDPRRDTLPPGFAGGPATRGYSPAAASTFTELTFRLRPEPWYRSNAFKLTLVAVVLLAVVASIVVLLWPTSSTTPQDAVATTAPPAPSPSPSPAPSSSASLGPAAPATIPPGAGLPPPPPPPPPPPADAPAPAAPPAYYPPRYYEPTQEARPPRTDVTRAPMSVAPSIKPPPSHDSSAPGDAPRRGYCCGF